MGVPPWYTPAPKETNRAWPRPRVPRRPFAQNSRVLVQFSTNGSTLLSLLHKSHKACPFSIRTQFDFEFSGLPVMAAGEKASVAIKLLHIALLRHQDFSAGTRTCREGRSLQNRIQGCGVMSIDGAVISARVPVAQTESGDS